MILKPYPKYKTSGLEWLGDVPAHWIPTRMKRLALIQNGKHYKHVEVDTGGYPVIGSGGEFARATDYLFEGESVLLGRKGTIDLPLYINGAFWVIDTMFYTKINHNVFAKFFYYCAKTIRFDYYATRTAVPSMTQEDLGGILFAVPNYEEQSAIAAFLDRETEKIDAIISKQEKLILLLTEKRHALISHAVTKGLDPNVQMKPSGLEWLGDVPAHWFVAPLGRILCDADSVFIDGDWIESKDISEEGFRYLTSGNIGEGVFKEQGHGFISNATFSDLNCTEVLPGDVLISRLNPPIGRACIAPSLGSRMVTCVDNVIVRPNQKINRQFIVYMLSSKEHFANMEKLARGTTMQRISRSKLSKIRFVLPSLTEQSAIAAFLDQETEKIDTIITKAKQAIALQKERRAALISAAVTGKIDVREAV